jgi:N-formylglutamate amidohydrolase
LEVQKTLHRIRLGVEEIGFLLTAANEKLEGLATLNDKLGSVSENLFEISERFDAPASPEIIKISN